MFPAAMRSPTRLAAELLALQKLIGRPCRGDGGELIDDDLFRRRAAKDGDERDGGVRAFAGIGRAALGDDVEHVLHGSVSVSQRECAAIVRLALRQLRRRAGARGKKRHGGSGDGLFAPCTVPVRSAAAAWKMAINNTADATSAVRQVWMVFRLMRFTLWFV